MPRSGPADPAAVAEARAHQDRLTKPRGALGALEEVAVRLAGAAAVSPPPLPTPAALAIFAADHGVHAQGVSPWPQEVTLQMVGNFLAGGAVANAFAAQVGASVTVVDVGVAADLDPAPGLRISKVAYGTADLSQGPAMTAQQVTEGPGGRDDGGSRARGPGRALPDHRGHGHRQHHRLGRPDLRVHRTGRGRRDGQGDRGRRRDAGAQDRGGPAGSPRERPDAGAGRAPPGRRRRLRWQGFGADGAAGASAYRRWPRPWRRWPRSAGWSTRRSPDSSWAGRLAGVPVILDGVIAGSAALAAAALAPAVVDHCVAGHRSAEPGHAVALSHLGLRPLVELELRLGEGTGGLLAYPIVCAAVRVMHEVATFDSAGVSDKEA